MKIGEVCLHTNNVIELSAFYKQVLQIENNSNDNVHQFLITGEAALTVYNDGNYKEKKNNNISLAFTVEDIEAQYERLLKLNVTFLQPPKKQPWGAVNMCFLDPDGNSVYFRSFHK